MAKKASEKLLKKAWKCSFGCDISKKLCVHVEALLPNDDTGTVQRNSDGDPTRLNYYSNIDDVYKHALVLIDNDQRTNSEKESDMRDMLAYYGLSAMQIDLLIDIYLNNLTLKKIAEKYNFIGGAVSVQRLRDSTLATLEERILFDEKK